MAAVINFLTVPQELQAIAHACRENVQALGLKLFYEHAADDFPETATIYAKSRDEHRFYIFDARVKLDRLTLWSGYGRSCSSATYVVLCLPVQPVNPDDIVRLRELGVGLTTINPESGAVMEIVAPNDLSLNIALPPLNRQRMSVRRDLGDAYKRFANGDWKHGFEDACKLVESYAREHLCREARAGQVQVPGKKGAAKTLGVNEIKRMPLGALADVFCKKLVPNQIDAHLCSGLKKINPDRISVAHKIKDRRIERRLRDNVGRHMWTIDNLLRKIPV
ncbi:hypothetical protein [Dongia sp.]|uniref:hypothetical protein n=1 Tax=Dongia sp. TaxID=1977262 RepID=UPI00375119A2